MRRELQTHTRRIRYDPHWASGERYEAPGRTTIEAVERGCLYMLKGFVRTQYELAQEMFAEGCEVFLTGGDAELVKHVVPGARIVPDMVFAGLALACPLENE